MAYERSTTTEGGEGQGTLQHRPRRRRQGYAATDERTAASQATWKGRKQESHVKSYGSGRNHEKKPGARNVTTMNQRLQKTKTHVGSGKDLK